MKLSLVRILTEEDATAIRQLGTERQNPRIKTQGNTNIQQDPFIQTVSRVAAKLKLTPQESQEIFNQKNIRPGSLQGVGSFSIQLSLPVAQSLVSKYGDLEAVATTLEKITGTAFMKSFGRGMFEGFFVPDMAQVKQGNIRPMAQSPKINSVEDFSNQIDQNDETAMQYEDD